MTHITFDRQVFRPLDDGLAYRITFDTTASSYKIIFHTLTEYAKTQESSRVALGTLVLSDLMAGHSSLGRIRFSWNVSNATNLDLLRNAISGAVGEMMSSPRDHRNLHLISYAPQGNGRYALRRQIGATLVNHQAELDKAAAEDSE